MSLITGASQGIGLEIAREMARHQHNLVLVARNETRLFEVRQELTQQYNVQVDVIGADLSDPGAPARLFDETTSRRLHVENLVNNAGFASFGPFADSDLEGELNMIAVNVSSLVALTRLYLPTMVQEREGRIMNVASTAAFMPGPGMAIYYATKAFVLSFSEALAHELDDTGVTVTCLCPGATATGFQQRADMESSKLVSGVKLDSAEAVAQAGYRAMMAGVSLEIPGFKHKANAFLPRLLPRSVVPAIVAKAQADTGTKEPSLN